MLTFNYHRGYVSQLKEVINTLPVAVSPETIKRNRLLVARIGQPHIFCPMLEQILNDRYLLADVAGRSYRHINHFDKIVLIGNDDPQAYRLTLHLWRPPYTETELCDELIHDHRFNFWSVILTGALTSENLEFSESGELFRQYRYTPELRSLAFHDFYEFSGETRLAKTTTSRRVAGESYYLSAPSIHRIVLPQTMITCTLVLRGPRLRRYSTVFNTEYPKKNTLFENEMFSPNDLSIKISALLNELVEKSTDNCNISLHTHISNHV